MLLAADLVHPAGASTARPCGAWRPRAMRAPWTGRRRWRRSKGTSRRLAPSCRGSCRNGWQALRVSVCAGGWDAQLRLTHMPECTRSVSIVGVLHAVVGGGEEGVLSPCDPSRPTKYRTQGASRACSGSLAGRGCALCTHRYRLRHCICSLLMYAQRGDCAWRVSTVDSPVGSLLELYSNCAWAAQGPLRTLCRGARMQRCARTARRRTAAE